LEHLRNQIHLEVEHAPREHIGLGVGTQLGLSVAAAICTAFELRRPDAFELAHLVDRGARSSVGTRGFERGGLWFDPGKKYGQSMRWQTFKDLVGSVEPRLDREKLYRASLPSYVEIPSAWKFVLFCPKSATGLAGDAERVAFDRLPPVPPDVSNELRQEALDKLLPAAAAGDLAAFSRSLYRFNHMAGLCFAPRQGGPFAAGVTSDLIEFLRHDGIEGVGQSSWGPTVFAVCPDEPAARDCAEIVRQKFPDFDGDIVISSACNDGARIEPL
jgi:beta-RFAP synthase